MFLWYLENFKEIASWVGSISIKSSMGKTFSEHAPSGSIVLYPAKPLSPSLT